MKVTVEFDKPNPFARETQPEYRAGFDEMNRYLSKIPYPVAARRQVLKGTVLVSFLIDSTGIFQLC